MNTHMRTEQLIIEVEEARQFIISEVNTKFSRLIAYLQATNGTGIPVDIAITNDTNDISDIGDGIKDKYGNMYRAAAGEYSALITSNPVIFVGRKPIAVVFGKELMYAKSWREVMTTVLEHCIQDPVYYSRLMELRGKISGNFRVFLSDKPDGMTKPAKIYENLYAEAHHGARAMMYALVSKILSAIHYDCSDIRIIMRAKL